MKKKHSQQSIIIKSLKPPAKNDWQLMRTILASGKKQYEIRHASGAWMQLPEDRKSWPKEVRELEEKIEAYDKRRRVGHRLVSNMRDPQELVS